MCLKCHHHALRHLIAMIEAGKNVRCEIAEHFTPMQRELDKENMPLAGGRIAELLRLTMVNNESEDGEHFEYQSHANIEQLSGYVSLLPTDALYGLGLMLGYFRAQFDITEDVVLDAIRRRAEAGDLDALGYVMSGAGGPSVVIFGIGNIGTPPATPPRRRAAKPD